MRGFGRGSATRAGLGGWPRLVASMRKVGLIGFGSIAEHGHLPAWQSFADVKVVAVADVSVDRLARARQIVPDLFIFDNPMSLISDANLDTLDICSPPSTHIDFIMAGLHAGIDEIVSEKPFVLSSSDFSRISQARAHRRVVSVNNWMHSELNGAVLETIRSGAIGDVREVELRTARPDCALGNAGWLPRWRTDAAHSGGGILLDHGWHQLYLLLGWLDTAVKTVSATMRTLDPRHLPVEDEVSVQLEFEDARGRIDLRWTSTDRANDGHIVGALGKITVMDDRILVEGIEGSYERKFHDKLTQSSYHPEWFSEMLRRNIFDSDRREASRNFREAGVLVRLIEAAYRSARYGGEPINLGFSAEAPAAIEATKGALIDVRGNCGGRPA